MTMFNIFNLLGITASTSTEIKTAITELATQITVEHITDVMTISEFEDYVSYYPSCNFKAVDFNGNEAIAIIPTAVYSRDAYFVPAYEIEWDNGEITIEDVDLPLCVIEY